MQFVEHGSAAGDREPVLMKPRQNASIRLLLGVPRRRSCPKETSLLPWFGTSVVTALVSPGVDFGVRYSREVSRPFGAPALQELPRVLMRRQGAEPSIILLRKENGDRFTVARESHGVAFLRIANQGGERIARFPNASTVDHGTRNGGYNCGHTRHRSTQSGDQQRNRSRVVVDDVSGVFMQKC
jgi:hypothetical protein